jgi:hypothetical protein
VGNVYDMFEYIKVSAERSDVEPICGERFSSEVFFLILPGRSTVYKGGTLTTFGREQNTQAGA